MDDVGRLAQPVRLARRVGVPHLGLPPRYRLLGLVVTPLAAALFVVARLGGGTELGQRSNYSNLFLVLHVGLVLAAFAGFTLAAGLAAVYLFQERRLKRHDAGILRVPAPRCTRWTHSRHARSSCPCRR